MDECRGLMYVNVDKTDIEFMQSFITWFNEIENLVLSRFDWDIPGTCDARMIEKTLFYSGAVLIFRDEFNCKIYSLPFTSRSGDDMYETPYEREAFANTGYRRLCNPSNSVVIYDSPSRIPAVRTAALRSKILAEIDATKSINVNAQKTPYILRGTNRMKTSLQQIFKKIIKNSSVIYCDKDVDIAQLSVLNTEAPERYLTLRELLEREWQQTLNMLGVVTSNTWKKERLVGAEAESADEIAVANRIVGYNSRMSAVERLRMIFPEYHWDVRYAYEEGGNVYGTVHNGNAGTDTGIGGEPEPGGA